MKKKFMCLLVAVATMSMLLAGCGKKEEPVVEDVPEVEETVDDEEEKEEVVETPEIGENVTDTRLTDGMAKVYKVIDAYNDLIRQHKVVEDAIVYDMENITLTILNLDLKTADGDNIGMGTEPIAIAGTYYYNYVNKDTGYYDLGEWFSSQPNRQAVLDEYLNGYDALGTSTNDYIMHNAATYGCYLSKCTSIQGLDVLEDTSYKVNNTQSAYVIPLDCDGDTNLIAVFDSEGNMLNLIYPDENWDGRVFTFN